MFILDFAHLCTEPAHVNSHPASHCPDPSHSSLCCLLWLSCSNVHSTLQLLPCKKLVPFLCKHIVCNALSIVWHSYDPSRTWTFSLRSLLFCGFCVHTSQLLNSGKFWEWWYCRFKMACLYIICKEGVDWVHHGVLAIAVCYLVPFIHNMMASFMKNIIIGG